MLDYNNRITGSDLIKLNHSAEQFNQQFKSQSLPNEGLGKNEFLKLLTVQLSHQNPLEPMDNTAFISQMAQFSSLEQMQNVSGEIKELRTEFSQMRGVNLIGKKAGYIDSFGNVKTGMITKMNLQNGQKVEIDGQMIDLDKVNYIEKGQDIVNTHLNTYNQEK